MSIFDELCKLIVARGGDISGLYNIADCVGKLVELENENSGSSETVDPETTEQP